MFAESNPSNPYDVRLAFVLDDEARLGVALSRMLAAIGIRARAFVGPEAFLRELEHESPDLIFLDLALGQTDAVEIIHQLEARKFGGRVMLISRRDTRTLLEVERIGRAHGLHMLPSLPKPFRMTDIKDNLLPSPALQPALSTDPDIVDDIVPLRAKA